MALVDFALPRTALVRLEIFDLQGRRMAVLEDGLLAPGQYKRSWDGSAATGAAAPSGVYLVRLSGSGVNLMRKTVLVR
jgi:hypothetical protein